MKMKKIKNFILKNKFYILSFIIPVFIMLVAFFIKGVGFNGEKLMFGDMQAQYIDMLVYFKRMLEGSESIFYSFIKGLGGDLYSTASYYMLSPFNFILLLFKTSDITQAIYLIILGKIGLCGTTMFILLNDRDKKEKISSLIFSSCYALMAFLVNSYFCVMWFDVVYIAPLVILGINKLIEKNSSTLYIISLSLALIFNFCIGYMVCIFSVIYFIYKLVNDYANNNQIDLKKIIIKFVISSLIAGLVTTVVWLPSILEILKTNRDLAGDVTDFITVIKTLFINSYDESTILNYHQPNLYCGIVVIYFLISYFFNKKNTKLEKISTLIVIIIFIMSILIKQLSFVWHGFSYPIGYNFRFSFLFCLFMIMIAHKEFINLKKVTKIQKLGLSLGLIILTWFTFKYFKQIGGYLTLALFLVYILITVSQLKEKTKKILILLIVLIELCVNTVLCFYPAENNTTYKDYLNNVCGNLPNSDNYRVYEYEYYGIDGLIGCGRGTTKGFYSTINNNIVEFYNKVGMSGGPNVYDQLDNTPLVDSLLSVKYLYTNKIINNYKLLETVVVEKYDPSGKVNYEEKNYVFENPYVLELGYIIKNYDKIEFSNPFDYQNKIFKQISGLEEDILKQIFSNNVNKGLKESKNIYIMANEENDGLVINGVEYNPLELGRILVVENNFNTEEIEIKLKQSVSFSDNFNAYYLDENNFEKAINVLKENQLQNIKIDKNKISGTIELDKKGMLMISIPYEKGWTVYVDGKKTSYQKLYDMFTGIELKKGKHKIELVYYQESFKYGLIITIVSLIGAGFYFIEERKELNEKTKKRRRN